MRGLKRIPKGVVGIILLFLFLTPTYVQAGSGCNMCAQTGNCNYAYNNGPGKYCGSFHDYGFVNKPCCCPLNTQCNIQIFDCLCHVPATPYYNEYYETAGGGFIFFLIIMCLCCCCCCSGCGKHSEQHVDGDFIPVAVPTNEYDYGSTNPPPTAPSFTETRSSAQPFVNRRGQGGNGLGAALGGFVIGEMIGSAIGRGERHHHHRNHRWGGGGFNMRGDTGGQHGGGFDIRGDTG